MRTILVLIALLVVTPILGIVVIVAALVGVRDRAGSIYDWAPRVWARCILFAAGARVRLHNEERIRADGPRIFVANHVSWFDIFALAAVLPRYKFIGKAEIFRIPLFGHAARAAGMIPIERDNRKAAFASYDLAASRIRDGASVVVCPEGTRGTSYALRPFKKGPFVLAVAAGVPIVPTLVHGTIHVQPKGSWMVRRGDIDVHFLAPVSIEGFDYDDRDRLARVTWERMAAAQKELYGIESEPRIPEPAGEPVTGNESPLSYEERGTSYEERVARDSA